MSDIVERLCEAANEIERLRETDKLREAAFSAYAEQEKEDRAEIARLRANNVKLRAAFMEISDPLLLTAPAGGIGIMHAFRIIEKMRDIARRALEGSQ
jgi:hypothetical protein